MKAEEGEEAEEAEGEAGERWMEGWRDGCMIDRETTRTAIPSIRSMDLF